MRHAYAIPGATPSACPRPRPNLSDDAQHAQQGISLPTTPLPGSFPDRKFAICIHQASGWSGEGGGPCRPPRSSGPLPSALAGVRTLLGSSCCCMKAVAHALVTCQPLLRDSQPCPPTLLLLCPGAGRLQRVRCRAPTVRVQASSLAVSPGRWLGTQQSSSSAAAVPLEPEGRRQYGVELTPEEWSPFFDPLGLSPGVMQVWGGGRGPSSRKRSRVAERGEY